MPKIKNWNKVEPKKSQLMRWKNHVTNEEVSVNNKNRNGTYTVDLPGNGNNRLIKKSKRKARKAAANYMRDNTRNNKDIFEGVDSKWTRDVEEEGKRYTWWIGKPSPDKTKAKGEILIKYSDGRGDSVTMYKMQNKVKDKGAYAINYKKHGKNKKKYFDNRSKAEDFMSNKLGYSVSVSDTSRKAAKPRGKTPERLKGRRPRD